MKSECKTNEFGDKFWYNSEGMLHREDGPAIELLHCDIESWVINGKGYTSLQDMPLSLFLAYIKYHLSDIIKS